MEEAHATLLLEIIVSGVAKAPPFYFPRCALLRIGIGLVITGTPFKKTRSHPTIFFSLSNLLFKLHIKSSSYLKMELRLTSSLVVDIQSYIIFSNILFSHFISNPTLSLCLCAFIFCHIYKCIQLSEGLALILQGYNSLHYVLFQK